MYIYIYIEISAIVGLFWNIDLLNKVLLGSFGEEACVAAIHHSSTAYGSPVVLPL